MLSLCTTCKPFSGPSAVAQRNALESWARLGPDVEVIVLGDEPGVPEICSRLGFRQVPEVARNPVGTPLVDDLLETARREARYETLAWVNSDILLAGDLTGAVRRVRERFARFLLLARRWNVTLDFAWSFDDPGWADRLRVLADSQGNLEPADGGMDVFVYPRDTPWQLAPFAIGRGRWDSALVLRARELGLPVVDATDAFLCVHPRHDYAHVVESSSERLDGPEVERNESLLGGDWKVFTALNSTHRLDAGGLRRNWTLRPRALLRLLATAPARHPALRPLRGPVARLTPLWRRARRRRSRAPGRRPG